jgi:hypothetical protein
MTKTLKDVLSGVKSSKILPQTLGKDPGVDYRPKSGDEADFADKHEIERHDDRVGNGDDVYQATNVKFSLADPKEKKHGYKKPDDKKVNEAKVNDEAKCNMTSEGTNCPVHGLKECSSMQPIKELSKKTLGSYVQSATRNALSKQYALGKGDKTDTNKLMNRRKGIDKAVDKLTKEETQIDEADSGFKDALPNIIKDIKAKKSAQELRQTHGTHYKRVANAASNVHGPKYTRSHLLSVAHAMKEEVEIKEANFKAGDKVSYETSKSNKNNKGVVHSVKGDTVTVKGSNYLGGEVLHDVHHSMVRKEETEIDEVLTKSTSAGETIDDFVHSKNPKFAGKSKEKRKKMALAAYYAKQRNEEAGEFEENFNEAVAPVPPKPMAPEDIAKKYSRTALHGDNVAGMDRYNKHLSNWAKHTGTTKDAVHKQVVAHAKKMKMHEETITDFVHSDNPKFAGKSKEKRKQMALAAYYAKQRNEEIEILEDAHEIAKKYKDYVTGGGTPETASRYKSHVNMLSKKTGQNPGAINKEIRKHVKNMNEDLAVPLLGGDHPPRGESDEAIEMVKAELKALANKAMHLVMQMPQGMHVEPWCQAKIAQAKSMVSDVHDYMIYGDHEEDEQAETPMTFPNMANDSAAGINV